MSPTASLLASTSVPPNVPVRLASTPAFELGGLQVRPSTREVASGVATDLLEPRVMQVRVALARHRGTVVSRDDLASACWGRRAVGDDAINRCIQWLGRPAQARGGFSIHTVKRVGYLLDEQARGGAGVPVLAVLAFDDLAGDPGMAWFSDGLSVEILQTVAQGADLKVIGHGSSFRFRGAEKDATNVAAQTGATHVLDGTVRRAGARLRVSAHLAQASDGITLWSMTFERELSDVFAVQDEIAGAVAAALRLALAPVRPAEAIEPKVFDLYVRARPARRPRGLSRRAAACALAGTAGCGHGRCAGLLGHAERAPAAAGLSGGRRCLAHQARELRWRGRQHHPVDGAFPAPASVRFRTRTLDGVGEDWLISYRDLELFFAGNDRMMGVAGLPGGRGLPAERRPHAAGAARHPGRNGRAWLQYAGLALVAVRARHRHAATQRPRRRAPMSPTGRRPSATAWNCARAAGCARSRWTSAAWRVARCTWMRRARRQGSARTS